MKQMYVWQTHSWPQFTWAGEQLFRQLAAAREQQGRLLRQVQLLGFDLTLQAQADILVEEGLKTSEIEGEHLNSESVRSSVARRLGLPEAGLRSATRQTDGLVQVLHDATSNYSEPLTLERLRGWHAALFPTGYSGLHEIAVGKLRSSSSDPMQVVSGRPGRQVVHYEAPPAERLSTEMEQFLQWWSAPPAGLDGLLRSAIAHFYFVTIHPYEDGNGRLARAITDMGLAQDEQLPARFYSLSHQIRAERDDYYRVLEQTQKGSGDLTQWLTWFFGCYVRALASSQQLLGKILAKAEFWNRYDDVHLTERQRKVLNRLLDAGSDFEGGLTTRKYVGITGASRATAFREIDELVKVGMLIPNSSRGRSASYRINI